jgi:hypothetical protein
MRVVLQSGTTYNITNYELAGAGEVSGFQLQQNRVSQTATGLRWIEAVNHERGNIVTEITFTVHKVHADADTAERFVLGEANRVPSEATAYFYVGAGDRYKLWLTNATVDSISSSFIGKSSFRSFRITGGKMNY